MAANNRSADTAAWVPWTSLPLRLFLGLGFMAHGAQKLFGVLDGGGIAGTAQFFGTTGLPAPEVMAWIAGIVEFGGGLLLLVGLATRVAAALLSVQMIVAALTVHLPNGFFAQNGGMELPLAYLAGLLGLVAFGGGALSLDTSRSTARTRWQARRPAEAA